MLLNVIKRRFSIQSDFHPYTTVKVISRNAKEQLKSELENSMEKPAKQNNVTEKHVKKDQGNEKQQESEFRRNEVDIQMIPNSLYQQIFGNRNNHPVVDKNTIEE